MFSKRFNLTISNRIPAYKKIIEVDSDKSISIRSFLISAISQNKSIIKNVLESEDVLSTIICLKKLGIKIKKLKPGNYIVFGKGLGSLSLKKNNKLNFNNSGTLARLLIGILSTTPGINVNLTGDRSLNRRSMKSLINLMKKFGATFLPEKKFYFPLKLISSEIPLGINYISGVSAQLKSAVMLAGLNSNGNTKVIESQRSRNHTENILLNNNQVIKIKENKKKIITIYGKKHLNSLKIDVPNDPSSAAFFLALTILNENSSLIIKNVGLNPTRTGFYQLLKKQGAKITYKNLKKNNFELRGDIFIKNSKLKPFNVPQKYYVNSTDEYPIMFVMAALTKGISIFKGIGDLANKESNRALEMQKILNQINVKSKLRKDSFTINGQGKIDASNKIINVPDLGDHRICMSSFVLALLTGAKVKIKNFETVFTSSPSFLSIMKLLGAKFEVHK